MRDEYIVHWLVEVGHTGEAAAELVRGRYRELYDNAPPWENGRMYHFGDVVRDPYTRDRWMCVHAHDPLATFTPHVEALELWRKMPVPYVELPR